MPWRNAFKASRTKFSLIFSKVMPYLMFFQSSAAPLLLYWSNPRTFHSSRRSEENFKFLARNARKLRKKKLKILLVSKLELKHIILYFKFWLLKTSIRGNFNYKYFHPSFSKYPFSKIKSSIASSLSKDLFLGVKSYILDL